MGKRKKRKVILFLVEGQSDREILRIALSELYEQIDEDIEVFLPTIRKEHQDKGGDITSTRYTTKTGKDYWVNKDNIEEALYSLFLADFFDSQKILPKDITEIIQIVDMDGAYVSDDMILLDRGLSSAESPHYGNDSVTCLDVERIRRRNAQKKENLNYLSSLSAIRVRQKTVKYSIYYFSCNLDHFFHRDANIGYNKVKRARDISYDYIGNAEGFVRLISDDPDSIHGLNYEESWNFIKKDNNSLKRHTNLNLLLESLLDESKKDG